MSIYIIVALTIINFVYYIISKKDIKKLNIRKDREISDLKKLLDAKDVMLSDIAHEIRSPIHGIFSISEALPKRWYQIQDEKKVKFIGAIHDASSKVSELINELLEFAKSDTGKTMFNREKTNFVSVIEEVNNECTELHLFDKEITLIFDNQVGAKAFVNCDKTKINRLVVNLIINAAKFAPVGTIIVQLSMTNVDERDYYKCSVIDEGIGILPTDLENIFKPFIRSSSTSTNRIAGFGLGLAICRNIVEAHDGKIWAENNVDKGARLSFTIPVLNE